MTKTFTQDDVVRYLYDDIPQTDRQEFEKALICDSELLDLFHELRATKRQLDNVQKEPGNHVVKNILDYSKTLNLHSVKK